MAIEDRGPQLASVLGLFTGLSWLCVALRVYVKTRISKAWSHDDTALVLSLIFFSTYCASSLSGVKYGTGRHVDDLTLPNVSRGLHYWWLCELFYALATAFIRLSIGLFLLRISVRPIHRHIVYGSLTVLLTFSVYFFLLVLFQCSPSSYFWGQYLGQEGSCIDPAWVPNSAIAHSVLGFTTDWIFGLLPIALLWDLQMNRRIKISIGILLSLGLFAGIATLIRIPYIRVLTVTDDFLFATTDVAIWSTVEPGLGLVAAGCAVLRPLFRSFYSSNNEHDVNGPTASTTDPDSRSWHSRMRTMMTMRGGSESGSRTSRHHTSSSIMTLDSLGKRSKMEEDLGGITVLRTVEISRQDFHWKECEEGHGYGEGDGGSLPSTPGDIYRRRERDMV